MSTPQLPLPVKLVISLFMRDKGLIRPAAEALTDRFGGLDLVGPWFPFDFTKYYQVEMGSPLYRRMVAFEKLIPSEHLAQIKVETIKLEQCYLNTDGKRKINIDPGYITQERFVLATAKNFAHRIYLDQGIYADLTLIYTKGSFKPLPWTYPDYQEEKMHDYLERVRNKYLVTLKSGRV